MLAKSVRTLKGHEGAVHVVKYNSNGQYCLSGGQDRIISLWNPTSGVKIKTYEAHGQQLSILRSRGLTVRLGSS
jgi:mitogen-activated protein kinase organizer 1